MKNILTIDLEEWFHANYHANIFNNEKSYKVRVVDNTIKLLDNFLKYKAKATFFVLGYVAEKHPNLIKDIQIRGHEIAVHGYSHELVYKQTKSEFEEDLKKSIALVEDVINCKVKGYRAPSWSITEESLWAWEVIEKLGLKYSASVFPIKNYLYGMPTSPRFMYKPLYGNKESKVYEIPASTIRLFNMNVPFSGGFYFRSLPYKFIRYAVKKVNEEGNPAIMYLHPREIDKNQPRLSLSGKESFIHYFGINKCEEKLVKLLSEFQFTSIEEFYNI